MKLELKHLAPYLPYGLKIKTKYGIDTMVTLNEYCVNSDHEDTYGYEDHPDEVLEFKPILRPLSDLTKDFITDPNFTMGDYLGKDDIHNIKNNGIGFYKYFWIARLCKHHFDVFGLIEKGLAIDINTL